MRIIKSCSPEDSTEDRDNFAFNCIQSICEQTKIRAAISHMFGKPIVEEYNPEFSQNIENLMELMYEQDFMPDITVN